eukprot:m.302934 g.302934  ORF g.302934 m.302934 type:complete len:90 (+) comp20156_c0_seq8:1639-1908(+)
MLERKRFCKICGRHFCPKCVYFSALLYLDATSKGCITVLAPGAAIPPRAEILDACGSCLDYVEAVVHTRTRAVGSAAPRLAPSVCREFD